MVSTFSKIYRLIPVTKRKTALMILCLMVIGMMLEMLGIGLVIPVIALLTQDNFISRYPVFSSLIIELGNPSPQALIIGAMIGLTGIYLIKNMYLAFLAWQQTRFAFYVQAHLSQQLFTTYLRQPYTFHLQRNSAHLIRNVTSEVNIFITNTLIPAMALLTEGFILLGIGSLLLIVEPIGTLIVVFLIGGASLSFYQKTRVRIANWGKARQLHDGLRLQHLQQGLGGAKDVKLLGRENDFLSQYHLHNVRSAQVGQLQSTLQQLPRLWLELLAVVGLAMLVITMIIQGRDMHTIVPTLGLFSAAAFRLMPSINRVLISLQSLRFSIPAITTLHKELNLVLPEVTTKSYNPVALRTQIHLDNINYSYPNAPEPSLNGISLTIKKGESVGFIGPSGSGKSTLVDVILGLLPPTSGHVIVDDQDIMLNLRGWQDQIGYVPQSIYLTDDSLRRNIAFGVPADEINDTAVLRAIKDSQLDEFVSTLPNGIETIVGERGIRLSGGQRQRIGIARALYHDPVVLVLDEATSALDNATEAGVMQAVTALHGKKTLLIVAHRLSTVAHCTRLYRLEQGKVVEEGTPNEIIPNIKASSSN